MATSQTSSRKRPAPGASPLSQTQNPSSPTFPRDPQWQPSNTTFQTPYNAQPQNNLLQPVQQTQPSNQLMRRLPNHPVVPMNNFGANGQWSVPDGQAASANGWTQDDDLDQRALVAKRDAEEKRKQIPPFIQKLSSFLDESRNTDLIRWSDSGDSFIVLDEDEFAKTLIPELFKHRNYASFVRQLNMYGFHKKVGLSDNSMRASERKNKNPSEYSNPYFKRGRSNLLWLIQKPRTTSSKTTKGNTRGKQEDYDDEIDETFGRERSPLDQLDDTFANQGSHQNLLTLGDTGQIAVPQEQLVSVQKELQDIRTNQQRIAQMLKEVRREHQQLYGQAKAFHDLHEKHDNSINAILTFLATVYNKNINNGQAGMSNIFAEGIPANETNRGNVVDMGDVRDPSAVNPPFRRQPLLLQDKQAPSSPVQSSIKTDKESPYEQLPTPSIRELSDDSKNTSPSPPLKPEKAKPAASQDILSMLSNTNAKNFSANSPMDFSEALSHLQNSGGSTPLTPGQRQDMLQLMGDEYQSPTSDSNINNALSYPTATLDPAATFNATSNSLDQLGHIIREQGQNIDTLSNTLTPLSPSGSIPGIGNSNPHSDVPYNLPPPGDDFDFDNMFNSESYFGTDGPGKDDFNFDDPVFQLGNEGDNGGVTVGADERDSGDAAAQSSIGRAFDEAGEERGTESPGKRRRID